VKAVLTRIGGFPQGLGYGRVLHSPYGNSTGKLDAQVYGLADT